jgi:hypothetical protein
MYAWVAAFGYLTFGATIEEELWTSYQRAVPPSDGFVSTVRLGFFVSILCTVPLILFPLRMCAAAAGDKGVEAEGRGLRWRDPRAVFGAGASRSVTPPKLPPRCNRAPIPPLHAKAHLRES